MNADRIESYATALLEVARAEGNLDEVEDELFRFARALESSDALRNSLTDQMIPAAKRQAIVEDRLCISENYQQWQGAIGALSDDQKQGFCGRGLQS